MMLAMATYWLTTRIEPRNLVKHSKYPCRRTAIDRFAIENLQTNFSALFGTRNGETRVEGCSWSHTRRFFRVAEPSGGIARMDNRGSFSSHGQTKIMKAYKFRTLKTLRTLVLGGEQFG